jgi:nicotinate-nucleotide adenylyltransferase
VRTGILGGTFDPPHVGHWLAAVDAFDSLGLDRLLFIPASTQPLKARASVASAADRLAMVRLMAQGDERFGVDPIEIERAGLSFTVDTLRSLHAREPQAEWVLCIGTDAWAHFARWREPDEVRRLATIALLPRDGSVPDAAMVAADPGTVVVPMRRVDVSSTEVRARVRAGRSVRGFVTEPVAAYIAAHGLYRQGN